MIRGTTPTYTLIIEGWDLTDKTVFVTLGQNNRQITKTNKDLEMALEDGNTVLLFSLTQEETLFFGQGQADVQVRFIDADGVAMATEIAQVNVKPVLLQRVISPREVGIWQRTE